MTHQNDHNPLSERLLEAAAAGLDEEATSRLLGPDLTASLRGDPKTLAEKASLDRLFSVAQEAFEVPLDPLAADRIAARVVDRVRREEDRPVAAHAPIGARSLWGRVLAISVGAHLAVLAILGITSQHRAKEAEPVEVFAPIASGPEPSIDSDEPRNVDGTSGRDGDTTASLGTAPYVLEDDRLPVERMLAAESETAFIPSPSTGPADPFGRVVGRALSIRQSDPMKRMIEARVGAPSSLDLVKRSLRALAARQQKDGSFAPPPDVSRSEATAAVVLAFLGDGHWSRGGEYRSTVERGIAWLRSNRKVSGEATTTKGEALAGPYELWALSEDFLLGHGTLTPAESRSRSSEIADLASAVKGRETGETGRGAASASSVASLALAAASRASFTVPQRGRGASGDDVAANVDPRTAVFVGTAALLSGQPTAFRTWAAKSGPALAARIEADGLAIGGDPSDEAQRVAETAMILLALQVPYRTL